MDSGADDTIFPLDVVTVLGFLSAGHQPCYALAGATVPVHTVWFN